MKLDTQQDLDNLHQNLKNPKIYPLVSKYIGELRAEVQDKYGITF